MSKPSRRYDDRCGVKERPQLLWMAKFQIHCDEFFRQRGLPVREQFKPKGKQP